MQRFTTRIPYWIQKVKIMGKSDFIPSWTEVKSFEDDGVIVVVNVSNHFRPRYSWALSFRTNKGSMGRFKQVRPEGQGAIKIESSVKTITKLLEEAEKWILQKLQENEDWEIQKRIDRESSDIERGKPKVKPGLKQLAKR